MCFVWSIINQIVLKKNNLIMNENEYERALTVYMYENGFWKCSKCQPQLDLNCLVTEKALSGSF